MGVPEGDRRLPPSLVFNAPGGRTSANTRQQQTLLNLQPAWLWNGCRTAKTLFSVIRVTEIAPFNSFLKLF